MVQGLVVEVPSRTRAALSPLAAKPLGLKPDFVLKTEIREFQAEAYRDPTKHEPRVGLSVKLVEMPDRSDCRGSDLRAPDICAARCDGGYCSSVGRRARRRFKALGQLDAGSGRRGMERADAAPDSPLATSALSRGKPLQGLPLILPP